MIGKINVINIENFAKAVRDMHCGKVYAAEISGADFEIEQFATEPLPAYKAPKGFPNCCEFHKGLLKVAEEKYSRFPNCCEVKAL